MAHCDPVSFTAAPAPAGPHTGMSWTGGFRDMLTSVLTLTSTAAAGRRFTEGAAFFGKMLSFRRSLVYTAQ